MPQKIITLSHYRTKRPSAYETGQSPYEDEG